MICLRSQNIYWQSSDLTGGPQKTPLPKVHGEHSLSEWDPGVTGYLPGPAVHTGLGGASLDSEWLHGSRTQGRTELGLWVLFCLAVTAFTLICCQRKYIMWREQYHKQHTPIPQFQLLTYLLHFYPTLLPFPPLDYFAANLDISAHCKHSLCVSITKKLFYNPFEKDFCPRK